MGLLDDAIREHLDLKRRHGASESEVARQEAEALGPVVREEGEGLETESAPSAVEQAGPSIPYDRAAEAGLTGEPDLPSFEWHGSSSAEPEVPSFVSPDPAQGTGPEPDGVGSRADAELASDSAETFDVVEPASPLEETEVSVEPGLRGAEGSPQEDRSAELSPEPAAIPEARDEEAAYEPAPAPEPERSSGAEPPTGDPGPSEPEGSFGAAPGPEPGVSVEPPAQPAFPAEEPIERTVPTEGEDGLAETPPLEDGATFEPAPTGYDLAASAEPEPFEPAPLLDTEASEEPAVAPREQAPPEDEATAFHRAPAGVPEPAPADVEGLPPERGPVPPELGPLTLGARNRPPEREPPPAPAGELVERAPIGFGPEAPSDEQPDPPIEEPFVAGEEEAWREAGEGPADIAKPLPEPPLAGASSSEGLDPYARPPEADPLSEPADEAPLYERPLRGPAPDAESPPPERLHAPPGEPLDAPAEPPPPLPADAEAARGFFDETAEHERPRREERPGTADPDFED